MNTQPRMTEHDAPLHLAVFDEEDLAVISAHLHGAHLRSSDMVFLPKAARFVLAPARFDWCRAERKERCSTGLHFEGVQRVQQIGFSAGDRDTDLRLLAICFVPGPAPSGRVVLTFAGGKAIRLEVECLEAQMHDLGERWSVEAVPESSLD